MNKAIQIVKEELDKVNRKIARGKGTWPNEDYICDRLWDNWHGEQYALEQILKRLEIAYNEYKKRSAKTYKYDIRMPREIAAGITGFTDTVHVSVESGDPGGDETGPDSFEDFMLSSLREWYDGARVTAKESA